MTGQATAAADKLAGRLRTLLAHLGADAHADDACALLLESHSSPGRHYHDLEHVRFCLTRLDEVAGELREPASAELALWFRDVVHDPGADDSELRSALLFDTRLGVHLPTSFADRVHAMIMATTHAGDPGDGDARFVADIDLSRLALPRDEFDAAAEALRQERGQSWTLAFFERLLDRRDIYLTEHFHQSCERQARRNIEAYLACL